MQSILDEIAERISRLNLGHGKKIKSNIESLSPEFRAKSELFFEKLVKILEQKDKDLDFGIKCYLKMINDMLFEQLKFRKSGKYSSSSFDEVYRKVYNNPEVMEYHILGLMISQFLWKQHFDILDFFVKGLKKHNKNVHNYLEIGGGHGLYVSEALNILQSSDFELLDISPSSIEIAKKFINNDTVKYTCADIFSFVPNQTYDFVTLGEVLEHVEKPKELLTKIHSLLSHNGILFISVPVNSPAIDHIYLFNHEDEIREMLESHYSIVDDKIILSEDVDLESARKYKITIMYTAFLKKK
jgi:2-polyprenyl-3-methyl-5-hydroxy-6-metoxy-1,4-benzoquinol methylase